MFIRLALLAILTLTTACEKQRRTIVSGFKAKTIQDNAKAGKEEATPAVAESEDKTKTDEEVETREKLEKVPTETKGIVTGDTEINPREKVEKVPTETKGIVTGDTTISTESPSKIETQRKQVQPVAVKPIGIKDLNTEITAELPETIPSPALPLRESEALSKFFTALFNTNYTLDLRQKASEAGEVEIDTAAGELLKNNLLMIVEKTECSDCMVNFQSLEVSINATGNVIISNLELNEEYKNEEKVYQEGALPELKGLELTNKEKALLLSQLHYNEISYADIEIDEDFQPQADISDEVSITEPNNYR